MKKLFKKAQILLLCFLFFTLSACNQSIVNLPMDSIVQRVILSIENIDNKQLKDITENDIIINNLENTYILNLNLSKNYENNTLTVEYSINKNNIQSKVLNKKFSGFKTNNTEIPPTENEPILPPPSTNPTPPTLPPSSTDPVPPTTPNEQEEEYTIDNLDLAINNYSIKENEKISIYIKLKTKPKKAIHINFDYDNNLLNFDKNSITFESDNLYDNTKEIKISAIHRPTNQQNDTTSIKVSFDEKNYTTFDLQIINIDENINTDLNIEEITPYEFGFITDPTYAYTAYYDVDYEINKMEYKIDNGEWRELQVREYDTLTNNACMIDMPYNYNGTNPTIRLRAYYKEKIQKLQGEPTFELEGYRIKATLGDYVEYFSPSAEKPYTLINAKNIKTLPDYKVFERKNFYGETERFYLALRPKSTSKFSTNGLSPTNFEKVFGASQDRRKKIYHKLPIYYMEDNNIKVIKFIDETPSSHYYKNLWDTALKDAVYTFNCIMQQEGIGLKIEQDEEKKTPNRIFFGTSPNDYAGLCVYDKAKNNFMIYCSDNKDYGMEYSRIKSTLVHEMGHLLGFEDSAYAINDSIYSYARNNKTVTYFQPNDIATLKFWNKYR